MKTNIHRSSSLLSPIDIVNTAFTKYFNTSLSNDFILYTTPNFKNIPEWFTSIKNKNIIVLKDSMWVSNDLLYSRVDIKIDNNLYRVNLIRTSVSKRTNVWFIDSITKINLTKDFTVINHAVCVLTTCEDDINGNIHFYNNDDSVSMNINISGLKPGKHAIHIHECGDLTDKCNSACAHFNPTNQLHGGKKDSERHTGDLGNITADKYGNVNKTITDNMISLDMKNINCIIGRSVVIHEDEDDNRSGKFLDSHTTGHAGKRIACGVIGISR